MASVPTTVLDGIDNINILITIIIFNENETVQQLQFCILFRRHVADD